MLLARLHVDSCWAPMSLTFGLAGHDQTSYSLAEELAISWFGMPDRSDTNRQSAAALVDVQQHLSDQAAVE